MPIKGIHEGAQQMCIRDRYNDEYINDGEGNFPDPGADATKGKRSLYIKVTTTTNGDADVYKRQR